ncbi:467_t:CDS:2, partial [Gigaspora margarita]
ILALVHTSEAACVNKAVYDQCSSLGNAQLNACYAKPNDFVCQCAAMKAIRNCYLQCPDDSDITNQGIAYQPAVDQVCGYASQQQTTSSPSAPTQPVMPAGPTNPMNPTTPTNSPQSSTSQPSSTQSSTQNGTQTGTKSSANSNNDGRQIFFAVILSIAALIMA